MFASVYSKVILLNNVYFSRLFSIIGYYKLLHIVPCAEQYISISLLFVYVIHECVSANLRLLIYHFLPPFLLWETWIYSLCLFVCFCFVIRFICIMLYMAHISEDTELKGRPQYLPDAPWFLQERICFLSRLTLAGDTDWSRMEQNPDSSWDLRTQLSQEVGREERKSI